MEDPVYSVAKTDGAAVGENAEFEDQWAKFRFWSWLSLLVFVALGLSGLFGAGPMSPESVGTPHDAMYLKYDRFARDHAPSLVHIVVTPAAILHDGDVKIFISDSLIETLTPRKFNPQPAEMQLSDGGETLKYHGESNATMKLTLVQTFPHFGIIHGRISIPGQMDIPIRQIVYP